MDSEEIRFQSKSNNNKITLPLNNMLNIQNLGKSITFIKNLTVTTGPRWEKQIILVIKVNTSLNTYLSKSNTSYKIIMSINKMKISIQGNQ